jgi:hypothetical protein
MKSAGNNKWWDSPLRVARNALNTHREHVSTSTRRVLGEKVWCPRCGEYLKFVRVAQAAKIVDVDRRTVYNYLKRDKVYSVKVAGSTLRVCSHCFLRDDQCSK